MTTLQFEIGDMVGEGLGLEFSSRGILYGDAERWGEFLDRLVEDDLCTPEKRDLVLGWPAIYSAPMSLGGWPCTIRQDLSHIKIALRPGQPLQAKAYLSVVPSFELFAPR